MGRGDGVHPPRNHKLLYVSLEILVQNPLEEQLDPRRGAIGPEDRKVQLLLEGRSPLPSVKYVDDL